MNAPNDHCSNATAATTSRANGRPSLYNPQLANIIIGFVREQGLSPTAAAEESGLNRGTLSRWRVQYPSFDERLLYARYNYRRTRLGHIRNATTRDGRPDWRTAAWELEHAFPQDYCMNPKRRAAFQAMRDAESDDLERARAEYEAELLAAAEAAPLPTLDGHASSCPTSLPLQEPRTLPATLPENSPSAPTPTLLDGHASSCPTSLPLHDPPPPPATLAENSPSAPTPTLLDGHASSCPTSPPLQEPPPPPATLAENSPSAPTPTLLDGHASSCPTSLPLQEPRTLPATLPHHSTPPSGVSAEKLQNSPSAPPTLLDGHASSCPTSLPLHDPPIPSPIPSKPIPHPSEKLQNPCHPIPTRPSSPPVSEAERDYIAGLERRVAIPPPSPRRESSLAPTGEPGAPRPAPTPTLLDGHASSCPTSPPLHDPPPPRATLPQNSPSAPTPTPLDGHASSCPTSPPLHDPPPPPATLPENSPSAPTPTLLDGHASSCPTSLPSPEPPNPSPIPAEPIPNPSEKLQNPRNPIPTHPSPPPVSEAERDYIAGLEEEWQFLHHLHGVSPP